MKRHAKAKFDPLGDLSDGVDLTDLLKSLPHLEGAPRLPAVQEILRPVSPGSAAEFALAYAARGMHVFPCRDKKPRTAHWKEDATTDPAKIRAWWAQDPNAEIGWVPGPSGHLVIDVDVPKNGGGDGSSTLEEVAKGQSLGDPLVARTPSGGKHLVYRMPADRRYGMRNIKRVGIDVRGFTGYVILPNGQPGRRWEGRSPLDHEVPALPVWLKEWLDGQLGQHRGDAPSPAVPMPGAPAAHVVSTLRLEEVRSALYAIPATVGRSEWYACILGVKDALQGDVRGEEIVEKWSAQADTADSDSDGQYKPGEATEIYRAAKSPDELAKRGRPRGITAATLFQFAKKRGWRGVDGEVDPRTVFGPLDPVAETCESSEVSALESRPVVESIDLRLVDWDDAADLPMVRWQVHRLLPERSMALLAGDTMTGKSFVAIDLALRLVHNLPFFGRKVRPCSVLYLCGEGQQGMASRLRLWRIQNQVGRPEAQGRYCLFSNRIPELGVGSGARLRKHLRAILKKKGSVPGLLIIDTLSQALEGDENDAAVTAPVLRELAEIRDQFGCSILIIHHTVKRDQKQAFDRQGKERWFPITLNQVRGSGAITRNIDTVWGLQAARTGGGVFELVTLKQKDGDASPVLRFCRVTLPTGRHDEDGEPETSCILQEAQQADGGAAAEESSVDRQQKKLNEGVQRICEAVQREQRFTTRDGVVQAAGMRAKDGRASLDLALSRGLVVDVGTSKRSCFVLAADAARVRAERAERKNHSESGRGVAPPNPPDGRRTDSPSASIPSGSAGTGRTDRTDSASA